MTSTLIGQDARMIVEPVDSACTAEQAVVRFAGSPSPAILETSRPGSEFARYSVFTANPIDVFGCDSAVGLDVIGALHARTAAWPRITGSASHDMPFCGGWIGYLGYESGLGIEGLTPTTRRDVAIPAARFGLYDTAAVLDHAANRWYAVAVDWPSRPLKECGTGFQPVFAPARSRCHTRLDRLEIGAIPSMSFLQRAANGSAPDRPPARQRIEEIRCRLREAESVPLPECPEAGGASASMGQPPPQVTANMSRRAYLAKVARAKEHIAAGDIYEVNLTTRFSAKTHAAPVDLYRRLRAADPSSHAALLSWGDSAVISASPELFLQLRGDRVVTRPIKGTRPRGADAGDDETQKRALAESEKDAAELNMIVDLLRNDLGRVCRFGSVRVVEPVRIETHPTVFHRVATIEGRLAPEHGWADLLRATFPGGSITGVPKIRAMQIIDQLEPTRRTAYCGAIGMIGLDGSMSLSVAIRTMIQAGRSVHLHAGGAIVADSEPDQEYGEVLAKARGMFAALHDPPPDIIDAEEEAADSWAR